MRVGCQGSASCKRLKSLALLCYGSRHWSAAAAGSRTSPGRAGGRWLVCSGWRAASSAAEASAERLLWQDRQNINATTTPKRSEPFQIGFFFFLGQRINQKSETLCSFRKMWHERSSTNIFKWLNKTIAIEITLGSNTLGEKMAEFQVTNSSNPVV